MRYVHHVDKFYRPLTTCDILCRPDVHITTATDEVTCPACRAILDGTSAPIAVHSPSPVLQGVSEDQPDTTPGTVPDDERLCAMVVQLTEVQCGMLLHFLQHNLDNTRYGLFLHEEAKHFIDADSGVTEPFDILKESLMAGSLTEDICDHCGCLLSSRPSLERTDHTTFKLCNVCGGE